MMGKTKIPFLSFKMKIGFFPRVLSFLSLALLTILSLAVLAPGRSIAGERGNPVSPSVIFSPGTLSLSVGSSTGIYHQKLHYETSEDDYYPRKYYKTTRSNLGFSLGYFFLPRILTEIDVSLAHSKREDDSYRWINLGGGFSYLHPLDQRIFLDLGVEGGVQISSEKHPSDSYLESDSETDGRIGAHSTLGFLLVRNLALSLGFYYEHLFEEYSPDILGIRARFSFFFPLIRGDGSSGGNLEGDREG